MAKITDPEILKCIIDALGVTSYEFATECGFKSASSVYNVLKGNANFTTFMKTSAKKAFPEINPEFLEFGTGKVISTDKPFLKKYESKSFEKLVLEEFDIIKNRLASIENKINRGMV